MRACVRACASRGVAAHVLIVHFGSQVISREQNNLGRRMYVRPWDRIGGQVHVPGTNWTDGNTSVIHIKLSLDPHLPNMGL